MRQWEYFLRLAGCFYLIEYNVHGCLRRENNGGEMLMLKTVVTVIGIMLAVSGAVLTAKGLKHCFAIRKSRRVTAKIVDFKKKVSGYSPNHRRSHRASVQAVYEYREDGEVKSFTNPIASAVQDKIGAEVTLYIAEDGTVREKDSAEFMLIAGFILAFGGFVMIMTAFTTL